MRKSLIGLLSAAALCAIAIPAHAAIVNVEFINEGSSIPYHGIYAGYYKAKIDGALDSVFCDDVTREIHNGDSWQADELTYTDMQNGANGKFANLQKYSQVGWLFSQTASATTTVRAQIQAAVWTIMSPGSGIPLDPLALSYFNQATDGSHDSFAWLDVMTVLKPIPLTSGQEFLRAASPVPAPPAYMLFLSGLVVLTGYIKKAKSPISV